MNFNYFIFNFNKQQLTIEPQTFKYSQMTNTLERISIFGLTKSPTRILLNNNELSTSQWTFHTNKNVLNLTTLDLDLSQQHLFSFQ